MVGNVSKTIWEQQRGFGTILETVQNGPLIYRTEDDLPFGEGWNTTNNYTGGRSSSRWASEIDGVQLVTSFEIPYANARGVSVTQESAKAFGYDITKALRHFFLN